MADTTHHPLPRMDSTAFNMLERYKMQMLANEKQGHTQMVIAVKDLRWILEFIGFIDHSVPL